MSDIKIVIAADVASADAGLKKVQTELSKTAIESQKVDSRLQGFGTSVQNAAAKTSTMATAASSLKSDLLSMIDPTELLVAGITAIGVALYDFITKETESEERVKAFTAAVAEGSKAYVTASTDVAKLREQIDLFNKGIGDKKDVVKQYNETLGQLTGKVTSVYEAERLLNANAENYVLAMTARSIADQAFAKGNELIFKQITNQTELELIRTEAAKRGSLTLSELNRAKEIEKENEQILRQVTLLAEVKNKATASAKASERQLTGPGLYGDITKASKNKDLELEPKSVIIKPKKIKVEAEAGSVIGINFGSRKELPVQGARPGEQAGNSDPYGILSGRKTPGTTDSLQIMFEKRKQALLELSNIVTSVLSPALDSVFDNIGKGANKVVQSLGNVIKQLSIAVFKALALQTISSLITGGGKLGKDFLGGLFKSVLGGGFASGSTANGGGLTMVGERGPELVNLPSGSSVMPNNQLQAFGGGGINLMPSIAYDGTMFRIFLNRVDAQISRNG